jgi:hypothetical protein
LEKLTFAVPEPEVAALVARLATGAADDPPGREGLAALAVRAFAAEDLLIADFEATTYGNWTATGSAFGPGPARGTLPGQMAVGGFKGQGLVNTFFQGDDSTGSLTSPEFRIERQFLAFFIGGGGNPDKLALQLLIDGNVVRRATGPNTQSGGSEALELCRHHHHVLWRYR